MNVSLRFHALLLAFWLPAAMADAAAVGTPAPAFALPDATGKTIALDTLRGQVVYVDFWASWCGPCRRSFPWMNEMTQKYGERGFKVVAINVDKKRADADRFLAQMPAKFPVVFDPAGAAPTAWDVKGMPSSFLVDARGNVVAAEEGFTDERKAELEAKIRALLPIR
jgi:cytochrome c biogenesis protein CcmG/thiol:disulfide interchange protein DsbE